MKLNEAKEILKLNGYLLEDTETNDEEMDELDAKWGKKWGDIHVSDKALDNLNKKMQNTRHKHMDLEDKINHAKLYNEENPNNVWDDLSDKEKIAALKKMLEEDGLTFHDENPMNPESDDIFADFYDIPKCADVYEKATDRLEYILIKDGTVSSSEWDSWLMEYLNDIMIDILNGNSVKKIVHDYRC